MTTIAQQVSSLIRQAKACKSRRQARLIRGKFGKATNFLSEALRHSAARELDRQFPKGLPY